MKPGTEGYFAETAGALCPACGLELPGSAPDAMCPRCLFGAGFDDDLSSNPQGLRREGERFGHYQLVRKLGAGAMGTVYEADDLESDRRVALKILGQRLDSPSERARFLNEGRLAASINHPNCVYVFGSEEIAGVPVISMELMPGGTLEESLLVGGPPGIRQAVDMALQIIDGLEAAHAVGILHRDIKPSNCFLDADGSVKIGDFGLSVSTSAQSGARAMPEEAFHGTPAFSSPEQLRGDALTLRSDLYSVGVTLFLLLTGKLPHDSKDVIRMLAKVLENPAPSPALFRPEIPPRLCAVVSRCLEKCPGDRFSDYAELRRSLLPFGSGGTRPAGLGRRTAAGMVDFAILAIPLGLLFGALPATGSPGILEYSHALLKLVAVAVVAFMYSAFFESRYGGTPGKRLLRLGVSSGSCGTPGLAKSCLRAAAFVFLPMILALVMAPSVDVETFEIRPMKVIFRGRDYDINPGTLRTSMPDLGLPTAALWCGATLLLFSTAHRRNGFSALHDTLTKTCVSENSLRYERPARQALDVPETVTGESMVGPFHALYGIGGTDDFLAGYDSRLLRRVWLRRMGEGVPPVPRLIRNLRRSGRLRWIGGKRSDSESWDAYEFLTGQPLLKHIVKPQPWQTVRFWLLDLADELREAELDGSLPQPPGMERVWITGADRAKILDFPAPGAGVSPARPGQNLILQIVEHGLEKRALPLPVREFLNELPGMSDFGVIADRIRGLMQVPVRVSVAQRLGILAATAGGPVLFGLAMFWIPGSSLETAVICGGAALLGFVALPAVFAAGISGGGVLQKLFGVAIVDGDGNPATAGHLTRRSLTAWMPCLISPLLIVLLSFRVGGAWACALVAFFLAALAALSAAMPGRGIQDRLAGTWQVPR